MDGGLAEPKFAADCAEAFPSSVQLEDFASVARDTRTTSNSPARTRFFKSCKCSQADSDSFLLCDSSKDSDDGVTEHTARIQVLFGKRAETNTVGR